MNEQATSTRINVRTYTHNNVNQRWAALKENKRASQRRRAAASTTLPSCPNFSMQVGSLPIDNLFNETHCVFSFFHLLSCPLLLNCRLIHNFYNNAGMLNICYEIETRIEFECVGDNASGAWHRLERTRNVHLAVRIQRFFVYAWNSAWNAHGMKNMEYRRIQESVYK
jgi:hypothetical protein